MDEERHFNESIQSPQSSRPRTLSSPVPCGRPLSPSIQSIHCPSCGYLVSLTSNKTKDNKFIKPN